jgi:hypothetical protein
VIVRECVIACALSGLQLNLNDNKLTTLSLVRVACQLISARDRVRVKMCSFAGVADAIAAAVRGAQQTARILDDRYVSCCTNHDV